MAVGSDSSSKINTDCTQAYSPFHYHQFVTLWMVNLECVIVTDKGKQNYKISIVKWTVTVDWTFSINITTSLFMM